MLLPDFTPVEQNHHLFDLLHETQVIKQYRSLLMNYFSAINTLPSLFVKTKAAGNYVLTEVITESKQKLSSKGRKDSWINIPLKPNWFSPLEDPFEISYAHLFDMRGKKRGDITVPRKIKISSQESDELAEKVSNHFKVPKEHVACVKNKIMMHSHLKYFGIIIIINDPSDLDSCIPILITSRISSVESEFYLHTQFYEHSANNIYCILFPKEEKVERLKWTFAQKHNLPINSFAFSLDETKVADTDDIENVVKPYDLLYLVKQKPINIRLELLQCPNLRQILFIHGVTTVDTISGLKNMLIKTLSDLGTTTLNEKNICISKEEEILNENQILNSIRDFTYPFHSNHSELKLRLHLVQPRHTWYKIDTVTAMGMKTVEVVCVNQQSTAAQIRNEVAKICCCPSQALKLVTSGKTIPENKCLEEILFLQEGCIIKASIASKIRVNVTVIIVGEQSDIKERKLQVEVYRLDTVLKLKQTVITRLESTDNIYTCVLKKKETLEESKFLREYGIKNETEVTAYIFKERIQVMLVILKMKKRIQVFIDEPRFTFVKDILKYVQGSGLVDIHYTQLRLIYSFNCLPMDASLSDVDVKHGSVLVVTIAAAMNPGIIMMCRGEDGVASCMIGKVIDGMIYYASLQARVESHPLKASDEPVLLPSGIHLVESACLGHDDPNPIPSLVLPSHLHVASGKMKESVEREDLRREDEVVEYSRHYIPEEKKNIIYGVPRMVCGSKSEGYLSEQSDSTPNRKKQKFLKRARALTSKSENNIPAAVSPHESPVSESGETQIGLNSQCPMVCSGQQSRIEVTSESASTCITVSTSSIGTGTSTYSASCSTVMQSNIGTVAQPMNFMNTGLFNMQNNNGESCKGGYTATVKYFDKDNVTWCYSLKEEVMQVTGSAANMGTPALINNTMPAPNGHNGGTTGLLQRSPNNHRGILVEFCGFTQDNLHSIASEVGIDWKKLGRKLSVAEEIISAIDTDNPNIVEKCYKMLYHWCLSSCCATKEQELADKLIACGLRLIAVKYLGDKVPV
ncbi:hypothetical protein ACJMK2_012728 [Sinanodonta woodiana]|uniref:Death domain-containing protein n=1 Tax=Sinanodonta woodiana TaxID=1069815 RepID=A0ABD3V960_SINWO